MGNGPYSFAQRSRTLQNGLTGSDFAGKPVIAIVNTWSDMNTCHGHFRDVAQVVKRGVWDTGGYPVELPAMSLDENMMKPTAMLYRNLLSVETEDLLRSNPIDGAVLLGGCDKTAPALITGTISMDLPFIYVPAGFMLHGPRHPRLHDNRTRMVPGRAIGPCLRIKRLRLRSTSGTLS